MAINDQGRAFVQRVQSNAHKIATEIEVAEDMQAIYYDRGYGDGGENELTDSDLAKFGITAIQLASYVTLCAQLVNLRDNIAVAQGDYGATLNQVRAL